MWKILEPALVVLVAIIILTQLVIPPFIGKRFFWALRKSEKRLQKKEDEFVDLETEEEIVDLQKEVDKKKKKINDKIIKT